MRKQQTIPWIKILILIILTAGFISYYSLGWNELLTLENIHAHREQLFNYLRSHYWLFLAGWSLTYIIATALSLPAGLVLSLTTGLVFGRWIGSLIIIFSASVGAVLVFLAARYLFVESTRKKLEKYKFSEKIIQGFNKDAFNYLLFLRLVPIFPFWLVNLTLAFSTVTLRSYTIGTVIGIIPGSFVFANLGQSLGEIKSFKGILSPELFTALGLLVIFTLLPILIKKRFKFNPPEKK